MSAPDFTRDLAYGLEGEDYARVLGEALIAGESQAEIKRKTYLDAKFYVELEQNARNRGQWKPSGLNVHSGPFYCFVIGNTGVVVAFPTERLRAAVDAGIGRNAEESDGDNPTRGRLIALAQILQVPVSRDPELVVAECPHGNGTQDDCNWCWRESLA